ncbi:MAG: carboxypeptidase regulatory-like domain-containing protein [Candidatus Cloacimonetes bacterium]|nr:carboxypeptidase regulatory-like domain-containing protein [Candidatus Cloacimonadota bacterium]
MKHIFLFVSVLCFAGLVLSIAETEPNDTWDAWGVATVWTDVYWGNISPPNDIDYWRFQAFIGDQIEINTCNSNTNIDTQLWLYDTDGTTQIAFNDDDCGLQSRVTMTAPSDGYYYFCVGGYSTNTGQYYASLIGVAGGTAHPDSIFNPNPADGAINVPITGTLSWNFGLFTDIYELWFGPQGAMVEVVTNATAGSYGTQGNYSYSGLSGLTTYEWQLILHNTYTFHSTNGLVRSFTTTSIGIYGTVTDGSVPLQGVEVLIEEAGREDYTDSLGQYEILDIAAGTYSVTASLAGFNPITQDNVVVISDQVTALDFSLLELAQVTVNVTANYGTSDGAQVTLTDEVGTNVYTGTTDSGTYMFNEILPGTYTLDVTKPFYTPYQETGVAITSGVMAPFSVMLIEEHLPPVNLAMNNTFLFTWDAPGRMSQAQAGSGLNDKETEQQETTRDLLCYYVFFDGVFEAQTTDTEYQFDGTYFWQGIEFQLCVIAVYDGGDSDMVCFTWFPWMTVVPLEGSDTDLIPVTTALGSNIPNPFNPETAINYTMQQTGHVVIEIYNAKGQKVKTLVNTAMEAGNHSIVWNGKDENGKSVKSGVFFYRMKTGHYISTKKMIMLR